MDQCPQNARRQVITADGLMSSSTLSPSKIFSDNGKETRERGSEPSQACRDPEVAGAEDISVAAAADLGEASSESNFTPPGSPGGLHKEPSVHELYQSARISFGGRLQPQHGNLVALDHPVRQGPSRMVTAQDWTTTEGTATAGAAKTAAAAAAAPGVAKIDEGEEEEEEQEPWRPPSPQPSPPCTRHKIQALADRFKGAEQRRQLGQDEEVGGW